MSADEKNTQDPNKLGWGFATVIIVLAVVVNVAVYRLPTPSSCAGT